MPEAPDQLRNYLAADERVSAVYSATLSENSPWVPASIGVTDRRLLCVTDDDAFVNVDHDSIATIRSQPRSTTTYRGFDYRLLAGIGALVVLLSVVGVVAIADSLFVPLLLPALLAGLASAEYQRRAAGEIDWSTVAGYLGLRGDEPEQTRAEPYLTDTAENRQVLLLVNGAIAAVSFVGIGALSSSWLVVLLTLSTVGGVAVIDYAHRHRSEFDGIDIDRQVEREVSIHTTDGGTVRIRCDASDKIDRELSRLAFVERGDVIPSVSPTSRSTAGAGTPER